MTTKAEALRVLSEFGKLLKDSRQDITFREFIEKFLAYARVHNAKKTVDLFQNAFDGLQSVVRNKALHEITPEHIDKYKIKQLGQMKPVSVNIHLRMLKSAFGSAVRWKLIEENPCGNVPFAHVTEEAPIFLTPNHFQTLLKLIAEEWLRGIVLFAVFTGLRRGEILNLMWRDVDLERGVILVQSSPRFMTKNGRRRIVPLNVSAADLLNSKLEQRTCDYVLSLNDKKVAEDWVTHLFKRYVRKAGFRDDRLHFHSLRHTFASWLVQGGATLYEVQKLLGHSSSKVTEIYSHLQPEQMHNTVNKIVISMN